MIDNSDSEYLSSMKSWLTNESIGRNERNVVESTKKQTNIDKSCKFWPNILSSFKAFSELVTCALCVSLLICVNFCKEIQISKTIKPIISQPVRESGVYLFFLFYETVVKK